MIRFVLRKMLNKKWLMAALLAGNILLVAIAAGNPLYTGAALQRMLTGAFSDYVQQQGKYPTTAYLLSTVRAGAKPGSSAIADFRAVDDLAARMPEELGLASRWTVRNVFFEGAVVKPEQARSNFESRMLRLGFLSDLEAHASLLAGRMYSDTVEDGVIEVVVSQKALIRQNLLLDETMTLPELTRADGTPYRLRVVGVYESARADDHYWYKSPSSYDSQLMVSEQVFTELFGSLENLPYKVMGLWFVIMDYRDVTTDNAAVLYEQAQAYRATHKAKADASYSDYYSGILEHYLKESSRITVTLRILQAPIYALLAAFVFMVSGQILRMEQSEISVLKSRGARRRQIVLVYFLQSALIAACSLALGLPLAALVCQILGSANAFLEFVSRQALAVRYTPEVFAYGGAAAVLSMLAMLLPALRYSRLTIVAQKQKKRKNAQPWFQRFFLDFILLGVALYGLYSYNGQKAALAQKVLEGQGLDPLLFLSSSLFIIGAGLAALRLIPALVWLVYSLGKKRWPPSLYASFLWVLRTRNSQGYIVCFLVITLAIGIFNAQTARTVNTNEENRIAYLSGADIVLQEAWEDNRNEATDPSDLIGFKLHYTEPDFGKYQTLDGAEAVTKVLYDADGACSTKLGLGYVDCLLMGIHTKEFGQCVDFQADLLPVHWYEYLNAMAASPMAVLVSSNMKSQLGFALGDTVNYRDGDGNVCRGVIYGFVEHWPAYSPVTTVLGDDGVVSETNNYLVVAHLSYMQSAWGITPYQVWMRAADTTDFIYDFAAQTGTRFTTFRDLRAQRVALKNDPIFQGTNGILTLCFVVVLLVCAVGFLIYWVLSIRSRTLLFGILRAMGMRMGEILRMLFNEQLFISGVAIACGVGVGLLTSRLYVPLVQLAYASADTVIPLRIVSQASDMAKLLSVVAAMVAVCMAVLGLLISKIKISQALKLGED